MNITDSPYVVGMPIEDSRSFFGRDLEQQQFLGQLRQGRLEFWRVEGLRRSGKTSLLLQLKRLIEQRREDGESDPPTAVAYVDLLGATTPDPAGFFTLVAGQVAKALSPFTATSLPAPRAVATAEGFQRWLFSVLTRVPAPYVVVMLDEFGAITGGDQFGEGFFGNLRAWATGGWPPSCKRRLTWMTAARHDDAESQRSLSVAKAITYLYNVAKHTVIGGLRPEEARALVREPAAAQGVPFADRDVSAICDLAGPLPYSLQAAADTWYRSRPLRDPADSAGEHLVDQLISRPSGVEEQVRRWWDCLTADQQQLLRTCTSLDECQGLNSEAWRNDNTNVLVALGLLERREGRLRVAGELVRRWVQRHHFPGSPAGPERPAGAEPLVFICHNNTDDLEAEKVAEALQRAKLSVFFDRLSIPITVPWLGEIERAVAECDAALVLAGPNGISPGQDDEIRMLYCEQLRRSRTGRDLPFVPVILHQCSGEPRLPLILQPWQWYDLREPQRSLEELAETLWRLLGGADPGGADQAPPRCCRTDGCPRRR